MNRFKGFARSLVFALAAVFLVLSLGPVLADDGAPPSPPGETRDNPEATRQEPGEGAEATQLAQPGCELDLALAASDETSPWLRPDEQVCRADSPESLFPVAMGPPFQRGFCRCGCGLQCETSADCGGAPCDRFITCC